MAATPHGFALVINNKESTHGGQCNDAYTDNDESNLIQTFRYLGYTVEVYRDCTRVRILEILEAVRQRDHRQLDSFVCCILTQGNEGIVNGSDGKPVQVHDVMEMLNEQNCETLVGKPKMFFIEACQQGNWGEAAAQRDLYSSEAESFLRINEIDFLFSYATPWGHIASRDEDKGSWYVSELCRVLCSSSTHLSLCDMLKEVHRVVSTKYQCTHESQVYQPGPELSHTLQRNIYFI